MGANIGTSVTNTIVAIGQITDKDQFRRAFAGATVHDMFNMLSVVVFLPIELITGYLFHTTHAIVELMNLKSGGGLHKQEFLKQLTKPFTNLIIQLNKKVIVGIPKGYQEGKTESMVRFYCDKGTSITTVQNFTAVNATLEKNTTSVVYSLPCKFLFHDTGMGDGAVGIIMLIISLIMLCTCLLFIVKLLHSLLQGQMSVVIRKSLNSDFPKPFSFLTGYVAILIGAGTTILVQSSSIFTSAMTPLVGMGIVSVERIYPLTLGANIGTTGTSILAALTSSSDKLAHALQISLCHLIFNVSGILLWYPVPYLRKIPIKLARGLGNTTARYRWFAIAYLLVSFFIIPTFIFALSLAGLKIFAVVMVPIVLLCLSIGIVNFLQSKSPHCLPLKLRTWNWLPLCCRSLEPYHNFLYVVCVKTCNQKTVVYRKPSDMDNDVSKV